MPAIELNEDQQAILVREARHFAERVAGAAAKAAYAGLLADAQTGSVSEDHVPALGELLAVGLSSGRIRQLHGADGETAAVSLFRRTPQGEAFHAQFDDVNAMFKAFSGQTIRSFSITARAPGIYSLTVETELSRMVVSLTQAGVDVRSVEVAV